MISIAFTYETVSPASCEHGETDDHGYWLLGGWRCSMRNVNQYADIMMNPRDYDIPWRAGDLRNAIELARDMGCVSATCGCDVPRWEDTIGVPNYETGSNTYRALNVHGVTTATAKRIDRVLNGLPVFG